MSSSMHDCHHADEVRKDAIDYEIRKLVQEPQTGAPINDRKNIRLLTEKLETLVHRANEFRT